jgi:hypothetical protein
MNALALAVADHATPVEIDDDIALSEFALEALMMRSERMHESNIEHDPIRCLTCFAQR